MHFMRGNDLIFTSWQFYNDSVLNLAHPTTIRQIYIFDLSLSSHSTAKQDSGNLRSHLFIIHWFSLCANFPFRSWVSVTGTGPSSV